MTMGIEAIFLDVGETSLLTAGRQFFEKENVYPIVELFRRGYRLGIVSSGASGVDVKGILREPKIAGCFETIVTGRSQFSLADLQEAAVQMNVAVDRCAYICLTGDEQLASARSVGFSIIQDCRLDNLPRLLEMFPPRPAPQPAVVYDASLSTMYAINNFPSLVDFFEFGRRMGFARSELNHKVTSEMLTGINLDDYSISSVHEPCPADIGEDELKRRDWLISSLEEDCRAAGVRAMMRSIDIASQVGAGTVVVHAGQVVPDTAILEKQLRDLVYADQSGTEAFRAINARMRAIRAENAEAGFASVMKSIRELLAYAEPLGICLGIENRYHYLEYPSPDELGILLRLAGPDRIGFIFDIGHAETLDRLGFFPKATWLERFADRIVGTHLHDIVSTTDHYAPGLGSADFQTVAAYLPEQAFRTCELQTFNGPEQVKAGLDFLARQGCIRKL